MNRTDSAPMLASRPPVVWCIAGSDSGGGAGIQADVPTVHALGGHPATALTAVTAQNSVGVQGVSAVSPELFELQLDSLAADLPPAAIKIGLLCEPWQVNVLHARLPGWKSHWPAMKIVLDPVMVATSGDELAASSMADALKSLLPYIDMLTPNLTELAALTAVPESELVSIAAAREAARPLLHAGCKSVVLKGGHANWQEMDHQTECIDALVSRDSIWMLAQPRVDTPHTHGTGCTLSSALATALATAHPPEDALVLASTYLQQALQEAYATGAGAGTPRRWLTRHSELAARHTPTFRWSQPQPDMNAGFLRCTWQPLGLYPVVPDSGWLARVLKAGAKTAQLRIKSAHHPQLVDEITAAVALGRQYGAQVFINDHWELAIELKAYGVHLGQEDLASADLTALQDAGIRLGISTHGYAELLRAVSLKPSYVALGHVFPTRTKVMASQPQGLARLTDYQAIAEQAGIASVAIGGIKPHHLPRVRACGVRSVAMVTAITDAENPEAVIAQCQHLLEASPLKSHTSTATTFEEEIGQ